MQLYKSAAYVENLKLNVTPNLHTNTYTRYRLRRKSKEYLAYAHTVPVDFWPVCNTRKKPASEVC